MNDGNNYTTFRDYLFSLVSGCSECQHQALQRNMLLMAECVVSHSARVHHTVRTVGCEELTRQAIQKLSNLSHVLFMESDKFSIEHGIEMATQEIRDIRHFNAAKTRPPNLPEAEQNNRCAMYFCERCQVLSPSRTPSISTL